MRFSLERQKGSRKGYSTGMLYYAIAFALHDTRSIFDEVFKKHLVVRRLAVVV